MNTAAIGAKPAAPANPDKPSAEPEWYQTDIEDFAPTPQRVPRGRRSNGTPRPMEAVALSACAPSWAVLEGPWISSTC
jgi:hypothetical protein